MSFLRFGVVNRTLASICHSTLAIGWLLLPAVRGPAQTTRVISTDETLSATEWATESFQVDYTGALFGYYRTEFAEKHRLPAVQAFLTGRTRNSPLLLGMGDNFAPEFGASLQLENKGSFCEQLKPVYLAPDPYRRND